MYLVRRLQPRASVRVCSLAPIKVAQTLQKPLVFDLRLPKQRKNTALGVAPRPMLQKLYKTVCFFNASLRNVSKTIGFVIL